MLFGRPKKGLYNYCSCYHSYPGHNIATEDIGEIVGNDCECTKLEKDLKYIEPRI